MLFVMKHSKEFDGDQENLKRNPTKDINSEAHTFLRNVEGTRHLVCGPTHHSANKEGNRVMNLKFINSHAFSRALYTHVVTYLFIVSVNICSEKSVLPSVVLILQTKIKI